jgi:hypothetical protein
MAFGNRAWGVTLWLTMMLTRATVLKLFFSPGAIGISRGSSVSPGTSDPMLIVTVCVSGS